MKISLHGGNCCGIKSIYDLGNYPKFDTLRARKEVKMTSFGQKLSSALNDMMRSNPRGKSDFFNEAAPAESTPDRFRRFVQFIKNNRKHGIIEVVLNQYQKDWIPIIEQQGFVKVSSAKNSNTGSTITVYHLCY